MTSTPDGVHGTVASEEPPTKNVRAARRGVAGGLIALVLYMLLTMYAWGTGWTAHESVAFARSILVLAMLAGLGVALYGYGMNKSDRSVAAAKVEAEAATFGREAWELKQFDELHAADHAAAAKLEQVAVAQAAAVEAQREAAAEQRAMREEMRELRTLVAEHDLRGVPRHRTRRRRAARTEPRTTRTGENVIPIRARSAADALRRLTERLADPAGE